MINIIKETVSKQFNNSVLAIIPYGSQVYKNKQSSDYDFYVVLEGEGIYQDLHRKDIDITIISKDNFLEDIQKNSVKGLETLFTSKEVDNYFIEDSLEIEMQLLKKSVINPSKIREQFSKTTSNSYVKAKKKIIIDADFDYMTSLKSLWHSIRINDFAIQILEKGEIDFSSMNELYINIQNDYTQFNQADKNNMWTLLHSKYRPIFNEKHSHLKKLCPKNTNSIKNR